MPARVELWQADVTLTRWHPSHTHHPVECSPWYSMHPLQGLHTPSTGRIKEIKMIGHGVSGPRVRVGSHLHDWEGQRFCRLHVHGPDVAPAPRDERRCSLQRGFRVVQAVLAAQAAVGKPAQPQRLRLRPAPLLHGCLATPGADRQWCEKSRSRHAAGHASVSRVMFVEMKTDLSCGLPGRPAQQH